MWKKLRRHVKSDKEFTPRSADQMLDLYKKYIAQMEPLLPRITHLALNSRLEIRSMQGYAEQSAGSAKYLQGSADGSRPGVLLVNTGDLSRRTTIPVEASAYHEGIPGHHLQIGVALQLDIPESSARVVSLLIRRVGP